MIKKMILTAFSVLCLSVTASAGMTITEDNVVQLNMKGGACSGTLIGKHTVLTAAHCVVNENGDIAQDLIGVRKPRGAITLGKAVAANRDNDLALILTAGGKSLTAEFLNLGADPSMDGDAVTMLGFGYGEANLDVIRGSVISFFISPVSDAGSVAIAVDASPMPGMSGGPVINNDHQLIGVVSMGRVTLNPMDLTKREVLGIYVSALELTQFLRKAGLNV